ncbi:OsmC family protein [Salinisphaera sp. USBA-960]|uniref:OsmC family protein n=1 Tax=Salinisphaera orenii TaxID=856731 RepID=UPI000DBE673F|nr:OsmC family protein [Salifodinibacter halophilus]NNC25565.1 OsmC family protein [Salifodinibacter halophilus]
MQAVINWQGELQFNARADSGHDVAIDGPPDLGGQNAGSRPMELMLMGVGACSAMDVMHILKKARQDVTDCRIEVDGTRADTEPKIFTAIHMTFVVTGHGLSDKQVARAVQLSAEKYCSASIMLQDSVDISHSHRIEAAA